MRNFQTLWQTGREISTFVTNTSTTLTHYWLRMPVGLPYYQYSKVLPNHSWTVYSDDQWSNWKHQGRSKLLQGGSMKPHEFILLQPHRTMRAPSIHRTPLIGTPVPPLRTVPGTPRTTPHATPQRDLRSTLGDTSTSTQQSTVLNTSTPDPDITSMVPGSTPSHSGCSTLVGPSSVPSTPSTGTPAGPNLCPPAGTPPVVETGTVPLPTCPGSASTDPTGNSLWEEPYHHPHLLHTPLCQSQELDQFQHHKPSEKLPVSATDGVQVTDTNNNQPGEVKTEHCQHADLGNDQLNNSVRPPWCLRCGKNNHSCKSQNHASSCCTFIPRATSTSCGEASKTTSNSGHNTDTASQSSGWDHWETLPALPSKKRRSQKEKQKQQQQQQPQCSGTTPPTAIAAAITATASHCSAIAICREPAVCIPDPSTHRYNTLTMCHCLEDTLIFPPPAQPYPGQQQAIMVQQDLDTAKALKQMAQFQA